jgi:hypothetical protein
MNGHIITNETASSAAYNHFLQAKTEIVAGVDDIPLALFCRATTPITSTGAAIEVCVNIEQNIFKYKIT